MNLEKETLRRSEMEVRRIGEDKKSEEFEEVVLQEYWEFKEVVFDKKVFDKLPPQRP